MRMQPSCRNASWMVARRSERIGELAELVRPSQGTLRHPPMPGQLLAGVRGAASGSTRNASLSQVSAAMMCIAHFVGVELLQPLTRPAAPAFDGRDGSRQELKRPVIVLIGGRDFYRQRDALPVHKVFSAQSKLQHFPSRSVGSKGCHVRQKLLPTRVTFLPPICPDLLVNHLYCGLALPRTTDQQVADVSAHRIEANGRLGGLLGCPLPVASSSLF
jgi:hypothetical protein